MIVSNEHLSDILSIEENRKYLELLSTKFPTISKAATEIINLQAILNLPKGTEHFLADLHGESEAFRHVLRNASGVIKTKVSENFPELNEEERKNLCTLVYYPEEKLKKNHEEGICTNTWYKSTLQHLIKLTGIASSKYTRSKTRKALPEDYRYVIEELLHESRSTNSNHKDYYNTIMDSMISIDRADQFITAVCNTVQKLIIDRLHIVGDIYDRGPGAHKILDMLKSYKNYDIQWGNHDILWMGAACGNEACIANVVRICTRYANFETLEDGYGINLLPLARFAMKYYENDPCSCFMPKSDNKSMTDTDKMLIAQMHKAISIIQFKVEHTIITENPDYDAQDRNLLHLIDFEKGEITLGGKTYPMLDMNFPTIDPKNPYELSVEERLIIDRLRESFVNSDKLQAHIKELYDRGSMYLKINSNLLYHAAVPLDENGALKPVKVKGEWCRGKKLYDKIDNLARIAFFSEDDNEETHYAVNYMWYLWCGADSPLFNKDKMTTFERYFIADKATHKETKGHYYNRHSSEDVILMILRDFGIRNDELSHIINGHVPVKTIKGESPIKANGRLLVIDGGFAKAYQKETGIAGYTLVYNSIGMQLIQHEPFNSKADAVENGSDIKSTKFLVEEASYRLKVADTDMGKILISQVSDLQDLLEAYRLGVIKER